MKKTLIILPAVALVASASAVHAQGLEHIGLRKIHAASTTKARLHKPLKALRAERAMGIKEYKDARADVKHARKQLKVMHAERAERAKQLRADYKDKLREAKTPAERRALIKQAKHDRKALRVRNKQLKNAAAQSITQRVRERAKHILTRVNNAERRISVLLARIETYIAKKSDAGADVSLAKEQLEQAKHARDVARTQVKKLKMVVDEAISSEKPREHIRDIREALRGAVRAIRAAHKELREAIRATRAIK